MPASAHARGEGSSASEGVAECSLSAPSSSRSSECGASEGVTECSLLASSSSRSSECALVAKPPVAAVQVRGEGVEAAAAATAPPASLLTFGLWEFLSAAAPGSTPALSARPPSALSSSFTRPFWSFATLSMSLASGRGRQPPREVEPCVPRFLGFSCAVQNTSLTKSWPGSDGSF